MSRTAARLFFAPTRSLPLTGGALSPFSGCVVEIEGVAVRGAHAS